MLLFGVTFETIMAQMVSNHTLDCRFEAPGDEHDEVSTGSDSDRV